MNEKLCIFCKHWEFDGGSPDYSEYTLGWPASMGCRRGRYHDLCLHDLGDEGEFRQQIQIAETCPEYEQVEP